MKEARSGTRAIPSKTRTLARAIRHGPDRLLHGFRRRRGLDKLRRAVKSTNCAILVICHGNIMRSPYASGVLRSRNLFQGVQVRSAGFIGPGRPSPPAVRQAAAERGIDLSGHVSKLITPEMLADATLIVVMAPEQARAIRTTYSVDPDRILMLGDLDSVGIEMRAIRDPYGQPPEVLSAVLDRIDRCLDSTARIQRME